MLYLCGYYTVKMSDELIKKLKNLTKLNKNGETTAGKASGAQETAAVRRGQKSEADTKTSAGKEKSSAAPASKQLVNEAGINESDSETPEYVKAALRKAIVNSTAEASKILYKDNKETVKSDYDDDDGDDDGSETNPHSDTDEDGLEDYPMADMIRGAVVDSTQNAAHMLYADQSIKSRRGILKTPPPRKSIMKRMRSESWSPVGGEKKAKNTWEPSQGRRGWPSSHSEDSASDTDAETEPVQIARSGVDTPRAHLPPSLRPTKCHFCPKICSNKYNCRVHMRVKHANENPGLPKKCQPPFPAKVAEGKATLYRCSDKIYIGTSIYKL